MKRHFSPYERYQFGTSPKEMTEDAVFTTLMEDSRFFELTKGADGRRCPSDSPTA